MLENSANASKLSNDINTFSDFSDSSKLKSEFECSMHDLNAIRELKIGDHICSIHEDRAQSIYLATAFLKIGIENWEKCLYICDDIMIRGKLEKMGMDNECLKTRQLVLVSTKIRPGKRLPLLEENIKSAMDEGYRRLRVVQEMIPTKETLEYETKLNEFFLKNQAIGLCQYMRKLSDDEFLLRAIKFHPKVYITNTVCENIHYLSSLKKDAEKELQNYLGMLIDMTRLKNQYAEDKIRSQEILKEKTKKLQDRRDAICNMLKDMDESYKKLQKAYEELQTLDKMKDEFISNVSHELKTPLISIKGYGELLYDEKLGNLSEKQKESLGTIIRNSDRLTRLINSILFMTKLHAGKVEFHFEPVNLDEIVAICENDFKNTMEKKQIIFEKDMDKVLAIKGEKDRIIEVVSNLLDNAIKFTPVGGRISIKACNDARNVHMWVSDNGIGIPANIIPNLFQRFYQVDASATRKYRGTGIGLYIIKNIIDAFHGKIWIESEVGKGTTIHILLPAQT